MIKQFGDNKTKVVEVNYGNNDIDIDVVKQLEATSTMNDAGLPHLSVQVLLSNKDMTDADKRTIVSMVFDDDKKIKAFINTMIQANNDFLDLKREMQKQNEKIGKFVVPIDKISVPKFFTNPDTSKLFEALKAYEKEKKINHKIIVDRNLTLKDGYIGYLVAKYYGLKEVEVEAKTGIKINIIGNDFLFYNNEVEVNIKETWFHGDIVANFSNCVNANKDFYFESILDFVKMFVRIGSVFNANFKIHTNKGLEKYVYTDTFKNALSDAGLKVEYLTDLK